jgi:hypothetical protein
MKDDNGLYYHPQLQNKHVRMYVRKFGSDIEFRLWDQDTPDLWEKHGWVPYEAIQQAAKLYTGKSLDPNQVYDIDVAKALLQEED